MKLNAIHVWDRDARKGSWTTDVIWRRFPEVIPSAFWSVDKINESIRTSCIEEYNYVSSGCNFYTRSDTVNYVNYTKLVLGSLLVGIDTSGFLPWPCWWTSRCGFCVDERIQASTERDRQAEGFRCRKWPNRTGPAPATICRDVTRRSHTCRI